MSPALTGRFLTTAPPGKSRDSLHSFLQLHSTLLYRCLLYLISPFIGGHLSCFQSFAITNNGAMNSLVPTLLFFCISESAYLG